MATFVRRAQEMGGGTLLVSLPRQWAKSQNLSKGSSLSFETMPDGALIVKPLSAGETEEKLRIVIPYARQDIKALLNNVTSAYLLGYEAIKVISSEKISYRDASRIKNNLRQLIGLEVVEEDSGSILFQFLIDTKNVDPEKIFRRLTILTKSMLEDVFESLRERAEDLDTVMLTRDDEVDRLYFLLVRLLRSAILNPSIASGFNLTPIDCLDYRVAANMTESAGDHVVQMAVLAVKLAVKYSLNEINGQLSSLSPQIFQLIQRATSSFIAKQSKDAREVADMFRSVNEKMDSLRTSSISGRPASPELVAFYDQLKEFCRCYTDISDLVVSTDLRLR
jgi:phosphate uptake regulator